MLNGRIIKGVGGLYSVKTEADLYFCKPRGIFRKHDISPLVGDYVEFSITDEKDNEGVIDRILDRKNEFIRPRVCNIDLVILVFAAKNPDINFDMLDRFIILAEAQNLEVFICINKIDLVDESEFDDFKAIYQNIGYSVSIFSSFDENCKEKIFDVIKNKVSVLAGPSGVGKSSIANLFISNTMEIGDISQKNKRGKHTTRHAELLELDKNTFIVDSPGFTSIDLGHIKSENLQFCFREFEPFLNKCKFNDCMHLNEPGCAIKSEINININEQRYNRYKNILEEFLKRRK